MKNLLTIIVSVLLSIVAVWLLLPKMEQYWQQKNSHSISVEQIQQSSEQPATEQAPAEQPEPVTRPAKATDVTMTNYSHDWMQKDANMSLKNNTQQTITSITGRLIYYDMSGNMLDYQDLTKDIEIEPDMVKNISISGYNYHDGYYYYKSKKVPIGHQYKVKFELKSYKSK